MQPDRRRKPRVLVVDDKYSNHLAFAAVLEEECELIFASSGADAIRLLQAERPVDVVLMDVHMPDMDGFETVKRIKHNEALRDIPVIFVTAVYQDDPFVKKGYAVGGIDYFSKPFDPEILRMKVAAYAAFRIKAQLLREREVHIKESEEMLRVGRKLSSILDSLPVGILIADLDGRICQTTETVARILNQKEPVQRRLLWRNARLVGFRRPDDQGPERAARARPGGGNLARQAAADPVPRRQRQDGAGFGLALARAWKERWWARWC